MSTNGSDGDEATQRWEGYSDYASVSQRVARAIGDAVDAYAYIQSLHAENARIRQRQAAQARSRIVGAAHKLMPELEANAANAPSGGDGSDASDGDDRADDRDADEGDEGDATSAGVREVDVYTEILTRWTESYKGGEGLLDRLQDVRLHQECPEWLETLVRDIRKAGWEIGYLQAGRTISETTLDPDEEQARSMFEE